MNTRTSLLVAALLGVLAVALGAFGAHALKAILLENGRTETWDLATRYQFYHTLAILFVALMQDKYPAMRYATVLFLVGILFFSGSLYVLSLTGTRWFGAITPIGGVAFIAGWLTLGYAVWRSR